jgi:hypothetical protein
MTERPIIFSGPMVRAILDGRKTQTRRVVKPQPEDFGGFGPPRWWNPAYLGGASRPENEEEYRRVAIERCPYGVPGDWLFVRESGWERPERTPQMVREGADTWARYYYDADGLSEQDAADLKAWGFKRRPSIHMPRWASRLTLDVVSVRVERLQEIGEGDAIAEGVDDEKAQYYSLARGYSAAYRDLWDSINAKRAPWESSPWVWRIEFRRAP